LGPRLRTGALLLMIAALAAGLAAFATTAESHQGHAQKKLFPESWHYEVQNGNYDFWMTLSTSDVWLLCDTPATCATKWKSPFDLSLADWNAQPDTVDFDYTDDVRDTDFDLNVYIQDDAMGDPALLGIAPTYGQFGFPCFSPGCVYSGEVYVGDDAHDGPYGTPHERQGTISHEVGHIIQLAHESVNGDESVQYDCGLDDTGVIPYSIMSYNCIDPVAVGGLELYLVEPWDVCGVNHKYPDPTFGFAGCDGTIPTPSPTASPTPTPTPSPTATPPVSGSSTASVTASPTVTPTPSASPPTTPTPPNGIERVWGDVNCNDNPDPVDSLLVLRFDAGLAVNPQAGCPATGAFLFIGAQQVRWGNVDCQAGVNPVDSLKILLADAGSPAPQPAECPELGDIVFVSEQAPA